jgi:hypothetical protein
LAGFAAKRRRKKVAVARHYNVRWAQVVRGVRGVGMLTEVRRNGDRRVRFIMAIVSSLALGLSLAACSKCDIPTWRHDSPAGPQSCHDGPSG